MHAIVAALALATEGTAVFTSIGCAAAIMHTRWEWVRLQRTYVKLCLHICPLSHQELHHALVTLKASSVECCTPILQTKTGRRETQTPDTEDSTQISTMQRQR